MKGVDTNMPKNTTLTYKVGELKKCVEKLDGDMDELLRNDLPHLKQDIESLKVRINVLTVVNVSAIILALLFAKFL